MSHAETCTGSTKLSPRWISLPPIVGWTLWSAESRFSLPFCRIGRVVPEHGDVELRELIFGDHRIWYRIARERVRILAIWDSRRGSLPETIAEPQAIYA